MTNNGRRARSTHASPAADNALLSRIAEILGRRTTVGLAVGVVHDGHPISLAGHGLADIASNTPVTEDTVFRVGSITKTFTAIALMQLWEKSVVDLDAPANHYLRGFNCSPQMTPRRRLPRRVTGTLLHRAAGRPTHRRVVKKVP